MVGIFGVNMYLHIRCKIVNPNRTDIDEEAKVGVVNYPISFFTSGRYVRGSSNFQFEQYIPVSSYI